MAELGQEPGPQAGSVIITAAGDLDMRSSREFDACLTRAGDDYRHLILDLSAVTFLDSSALAVVVRQWKQLIARGGTLALAGVRQRAAKVFWITGLAGRIPSYATVAEATAALVPDTAGE